MARPDAEAPLRSLALLYLAMGHGTDNFLSGNELDAITDRLHERYPDEDRAAVQDIVGEVMTVYMEMDDVMDAAMEAIRTLRDELPARDRAEILKDLLTVAQADGVVMDNERSLLNTLADTWEIAHLREAEPHRAEAVSAAHRWGVLHHLALIYIVLAHGTDNELSEHERTVMLNKLQEWQPQHSEAEVSAILEAALERYARGVDDDMFTESVFAVKEHLPAKQRMAALNDLIKIANADGVFLDREEDLINQLLSAWEVMPYANYGRHGSKE